MVVIDLISREGMSAVKEWKSVGEQLALLRQRGMEVDDDQAAMDYLHRLGYYRLSGYWYPLRIIDSEASQAAGKPVRCDDFIAGSHFKDVVHLYIFDKKLRLLALDALERIEMAVRVDVAHLLGERDRYAHENADCLHGNFTKKTFRKGRHRGRTAHAVWLEKYQGLVERSRQLPFVAHHRQSYGGRLPIWVAIEVWDFGLLSHFFSGLRLEDQELIADKYGAESGRAFANWLRSLNFMRNVAAHHSRMWNMNVLELVPVPAGWPEMPNARPFLYFCVMQKLLGTICPNSSWSERFKALLENEFPDFPRGSVSREDIGLPRGWEEWELWSRK